MTVSGLPPPLKVPLKMQPINIIIDANERSVVFAQGHTIGNAWHYVASATFAGDGLDPDGRWVTISSNHVHINSEGAIDAGGPAGLREHMGQGDKDRKAAKEKWNKTTPEEIAKTAHKGGIPTQHLQRAQDHFSKKYTENATTQFKLKSQYGDKMPPHLKKIHDESAKEMGKAAKHIDKLNKAILKTDKTAPDNVHAAAKSGQKVPREHITAAHDHFTARHKESLTLASNLAKQYGNKMPPHLKELRDKVMKEGAAAAKKASDLKKKLKTVNMSKDNPEFWAEKVYFDGLPLRRVEVLRKLEMTPGMSRDVAWKLLTTAEVVGQPGDKPCRKKLKRSKATFAAGDARDQIKDVLARSSDVPSVKEGMHLFDRENCRGLRVEKISGANFTATPIDRHGNKISETVCLSTTAGYPHFTRDLRSLADDARRESRRETILAELAAIAAFSADELREGSFVFDTVSFQGYRIDQVGKTILGTPIDSEGRESGTQAAFKDAGRFKPYTEIVRELSKTLYREEARDALAKIVQDVPRTAIFQTDVQVLDAAAMRALRVDKIEGENFLATPIDRYGHPVGNQVRVSVFGDYRTFTRPLQSLYQQAWRTAA